MKRTNKPNTDSGISAAYRKVPEIGTSTTRWYDYLYNFLCWTIKGKRKRVLPHAYQTFALRLINTLIQINEFERHVEGDGLGRYDNFSVAEDERVSFESILLTEVYTANEAERLINRIKKNGWNNQGYAWHKNDDNITKLKRSRSKQGAAWWKMADLINYDTKSFMPGSKTTHLPREFESIHLRAIQLGSGLTAVLFTFRLTDEAKSEVDEVWKSDHKPKLGWLAGRLKVYDRSFVAVANTVSSRDCLNNAASKWVKAKCPGYYSLHDERHLIMNTITLAKFNPLADTIKVDQMEAKTMKAIGLDLDAFRRITSRQLSGQLLQEMRVPEGSEVPLGRTWSLIANHSVLSEASENFKYYSDAEGFLTHNAEDGLSHVLVLLSLQEIASIIEHQLSIIRDQAEKRYGKFKINKSRELSRKIMDSSFTLTSIRQDIVAIQNNKWWLDEIELLSEVSPQYIRKGDKPSVKINVTENIIEDLADRFERLTSFDKDVRDILTIVASIGSSATSTEISRWSLVSSMLSLIVAGLALYVAYLSLTAQ